MRFEKLMQHVQRAERRVELKVALAALGRLDAFSTEEPACAPIVHARGAAASYV